MSGLLSTSLSGLLAAQRSLETVQHNIANVNTDGYSRQTVELGTKPAQLTGDGYVGQGVNVTNITRSYDQFITKNLNSSLSSSASADRYLQLATQVDNLMGAQATSVDPKITSFFSSVNAVANDPTSIPTRQVMLSDANNLAQSLNSMNNQLGNIRSQNNGSITSNVDNINALSTSIASLNVQIASGFGKTQGVKQPNDLLDQQGALLSKLASIVNITVVPQQNGTSSVFIGSGQTLVQNGSSATFTTSPSASDPHQLNIGIKSPTGNIDVTSQITSGSLGGQLRFQDEILNPAQQKLGQVAAGIAMTVNAIHEKGFDLSGTAGTALFNLPVIPVVPNTTNTGSATVTATFQDVNINPSAAKNLDFSDFNLKYVNSGGGVDYTLTRKSDNQVINLTATTVGGVSTLSLASTQPSKAAVLPGIDIKVSGSIAVGDQFLTRPTYNAAQGFSVNISDPSKIAAATNIEIDPITNLPVPKLDALGAAIMDAQGNPVYVTVPMPSDNRNALLLANLQNNLSMLGGNATLNNAYGQIVSGIGTLTQNAQLNSAAQKAGLTQAQASQSNLSGVNLDEEAANLIKFQQAYQASAQSVAIAKSLFDTFLNAVR